MNFKQVSPSFNNQDFWLCEDDGQKRVLSVFKGNDYIEVLYAWPAGSMTHGEAMSTVSHLYPGELVIPHSSFEDNQRLNEGIDPLIINHGQVEKDKYTQRRLILVNGNRYYDYQGITISSGSTVGAQLECGGGHLDRLIKSLKEVGVGGHKHVECDPEEAEVDDPSPVDKGFNGKPLKHRQRK